MLTDPDTHDQPKLLTPRAWMRALASKLEPGWCVVATQLHNMAPLVWSHPTLRRDDVSRCVRAGVIAVAKRKVAPESDLIEYVIRRSS
jgi:hypothetical protein